MHGVASFIKCFIGVRLELMDRESDGGALDYP